MSNVVPVAFFAAERPFKPRIDHDRCLREVTVRVSSEAPGTGFWAFPGSGVIFTWDNSEPLGALTADGLSDSGHI
jgi:ferredoxin-like protein FixX